MCLFLFGFGPNYGGEIQNLKLKVTEGWYDSVTVLIKPQPKRTKTGNCHHHVRHFCCKPVTICRSQLLLNRESVSYEARSQDGSWITATECQFKFRLLFQHESTNCFTTLLNACCLDLCGCAVYLLSPYTLCSGCFFKEYKYFLRANSHFTINLRPNSVPKEPHLLQFPTFPHSPPSVCVCMCVCSLRVHWLWLHLWDPRLLCSPGMNPSERSLEYSLLNLGEGRRIQPDSLLCSPVSKHMVTEHLEHVLGDHNYLAWAAAAEETSR